MEDRIIYAKYSDDRNSSFRIKTAIIDRDGKRIVRKYAMGKGYSRFGMREIIRIGLEDMNLSSIYWYVDKNNQRAIKFYDKNGYQRISPEIIGGYQQNLYLV